jgi:hypothetical protein
LLLLLLLQLQLAVEPHETHWLGLLLLHQLLLCLINASHVVDLATHLATHLTTHAQTSHACHLLWLLELHLLHLLGLVLLLDALRGGCLHEHRPTLC